MVLPTLSEIETPDRCDDLAFQQVDPTHLRGGTSAQLTVVSPGLTQSTAPHRMPHEHARTPPLEVTYEDELGLWADGLVERSKHVDPPASGRAGGVRWTIEEGQLQEEEQLPTPRNSLQMGHSDTCCLDEPTEIPSENGVSSSNHRYSSRLQSNNPFMKPRRQRTSSWSDLTSNPTKNLFSLGSDTADSQSSKRLIPFLGPIILTGNNFLLDNTHTSVPNEPDSKSSPFSYRPSSHDIGFHLSPPADNQREETVPWFSLTFTPEANNTIPQDNQTPSAINSPFIQNTSLIPEPVSDPHGDIASEFAPVLPVSTNPAHYFPGRMEVENTQHSKPPAQHGAKLAPEECFLNASSEKAPAVSLVKTEESFLLDRDVSESGRSSPTETSPTNLPLQQTTGTGAPQSQLGMERDKQSETYDIRHVNWTDGTTALRQSPILVQNENGPCPLLALVNGLAMRARPNTQPPIVKALQSREKISLGLLIQALFDELTSYNEAESELPDIEALSTFLTMLHTGMNVNPHLIPVQY